MKKRGNRTRDITQEELMECLFYDDFTGLFLWKQPLGGKIVGSLAGTMVSEGYISIGLGGRYYKAHRLAWLYVYGEWPPGQIDHINGKTGDNRIANLRLATQQQNLYNRQFKRNRTGFRGVFQFGEKFIAIAAINGERNHLGTFKTAEAASAAYEAFVEPLQGEFYRSPVHRVPDNMKQESADDGSRPQ